MCQRILLIFVVAMFVPRAVLSDERDKDKSQLNDFLTAAGNKLDCYFTLETWIPGGSHSSRFNGVKLRQGMPTSIDSLIAQLKREVPGIVVTRDPANARILHLIDGGLLKESRYALERRASIDFSGPLDDLPDALGRNMWYAVRLSDRARGEFRSSIVSMARIHAEQTVIRQILTDAVPLKNYGRILWIANTRIYNDGHPGTEITYMNPNLNSASGKNEGAIVEVSIPAECTLNRPIPVTVVIRNTGEKPFYCMTVGDLPNNEMEMELTDRDTDQPVKMTENGQQTIESDRLLGDGVGLGYLVKGKSLISGVDLDEFFAPPAGRYRLAVKFHFYRDSGGRDLPVSVGPVDFVVAK